MPPSRGSQSAATVTMKQWWPPYGVTIANRPTWRTCFAVYSFWKQKSNLRAQQNMFQEWRIALQMHCLETSWRFSHSCSTGRGRASRCPLGSGRGSDGGAARDISSMGELVQYYIKNS